MLCVCRPLQGSTLRPFIGSQTFITALNYSFSPVTAALSTPCQRAARSLPGGPGLRTHHLARGEQWALSLMMRRQVLWAWVQVGHASSPHASTSPVETSVPGLWGAGGW